MHGNHTNTIINAFRLAQSVSSLALQDELATSLLDLYFTLICHADWWMSPKAWPEIKLWSDYRNGFWLIM